MDGRIITIPSGSRITAIDRLIVTARGSLIDADLTNFPVGIEIPAATGFLYGKGATDWNYLHARSCGQECYVEVDQWDTDNDTAILWIKVPAIRSGNDHKIELYFGADNTTTYVGETGDTAAQNVWDSNFVAVYHMSQDPTGGSGCILDSTSNGNNGTPAGSMTSGDLVDAGLGKALDFDGTDDLINCGNDSSLANISNITIESYIKLKDLDGDYAWSHLINKTNWFISTDPSNNRSIFGANYSTENGRWSFDEFDTLSFFYFALRYDMTSSANDPIVDISSVSKSITEYEPPIGTYISDASENLYIGNSSDANRGIYGQFSEVRISNTARSAAWIKATNAVLQKTLVTLS